MREIFDMPKLERYLDQYKIRELFETEALSFHLCQYDKGEIIRCSTDENQRLYFLVEGAVQIYAVHEDSGGYPFSYINHFTLLGDMEFCGAPTSSLLVEVVKPALCVELPLYTLKSSLLNDNTFLRFLLRSVSHKLVLFARSETAFSSLEEKLLHYMEHECPDHQFQGVEAVAIQLRCSRRQLQRILKSLSERQVIRKVKKGTYRLV
ncbi:MAG: cyclic nucleotide-binding domain-containing protein [Clostridiales bacterium]|nr:cyclic nucleotide-binding domain-containing protein [Clostridiales bacterium]